MNDREYRIDEAAHVALTSTAGSPAVTSDPTKVGKCGCCDAKIPMNEEYLFYVWVNSGGHSTGSRACKRCASEVIDQQLRSAEVLVERLKACKLQALYNQ